MFQDLDDHPGMTSKLMSTAGKGVKVCQDKCIVLAGGAHKKEGKIDLQNVDLDNFTCACTNRGLLCIYTY